VQIYVEVERARLTRMLAALKEEEGDTTAASDILQEARVAGLPAQLPPQCTN
jgi:26S proteasome regulatory subunit N5